MIDETDRDYHMRRARAELDLAYRSECRAAMESHLRLSSLHMRRLSGLRSAIRASLFPNLVSTAAEGFSRSRASAPLVERELQAISG